MQETKSYKKLIVFKKSKELVLLIYRLTKKYPKEELYVLVSQMRRAAISILANLVEGYVKSKKTLINSLSICIGSAMELSIYIELSSDLKYLNKKEFDAVYNLLGEVIKLLYGYQKSLK